MARSYFSIVLEHGADQVWQVIRPFDHYAWAGVGIDAVIEDGKAGDQVGAVRRVQLPDKKVIRQRLLAHSDISRSYTYAFCDGAPFPVRNYEATIRVSPVTESGAAFVEWSATFDCGEECEHWTNHFEKESFAKWLGSLRNFMKASAAPTFLGAPSR